MRAFLSKKVRSNLREALELSEEEVRNARALTIKWLDEIDGISCVNPQEALYAFPKVDAVGKSVGQT